MSAINKRVDQATYTKIRSAYKISTISQCVNELVSNALWAGSTSIAVRLHFSKFRIQVIDNGRGMTEQLMCDIGEKKLPSTDPSNKSVLGENVFFIVQLAEKVNIQSKTPNGQTYRKEFFNGKVKRHMQDKIVRSCHGTTITVKNLLHGFPVRQKYATKIQEITLLIDRISNLSILFPNVSFSIRDDEDYIILLKAGHTVDALNAFRALFGAVYPHNFYSSENLASDNLHGQLFLGVRSHNDKTLQFVSINDRPLHKNSRLHQYMEELCSKHVERSSGGGHAVFILKLSCDNNRVEIVDNAGESFVHFSISTSIIEFMKQLVEKCFRKDPVSRETVFVKADANFFPELPQNSKKIEELKFDGFTLPEEITECMPEDEKISLIDTEREKNLARKEDFGNIVGKEAGIFHGFFNFEDDQDTQEEEGCNMNILGVWSSLHRVPNSDADSCLHTLVSNHDSQKMSDAIKLTKDQVDDLKVINQIDNKFIVCDKVDQKNSKLKHLILVFDQHAVSERIRLEKLIKESFALEFDFLRMSIYGDKIFVQKAPVIFRDNTSAGNYKTFDLCRDVFKLISQIVE
uniref:Histidine kinase/HSP90-like ATPase domain-containing protein n=1 Tax=Romanomermis culicivorax TaxID=13658 RepID=A0A915K6M0_ROMCU